MKINENRKSLVSISTIIRKGNKEYTLCEGAVNHIEEKIFGPIEDYNPLDDIDVQETPLTNTLELMQSNAESIAKASLPFGNIIYVSDIKEEHDIRFFYIMEALRVNNTGFAVYEIHNAIYTCDYNDFQDMYKDIEVGISDINRLTYRYDDPTEEAEYFISTNQSAALDMIDTIFRSLGIANHLEEDITIRVPKLGSDGDRNKSKLVDDILHGDEDTREFEESVEKDTLKAQIQNPLVDAPPAQENASANPKLMLPNAHELVESKLNESKEDMEIIYEPMDWVIIKENGMKAQVIDVVNDGDGKLSMLTILASNGITYDCDNLSEIMPDPLYLENLPGRVLNSQGCDIPDKAQFDIDPETRMTKPVENDEIPDNLHDDLNGKKAKVYVLVNGMRLTTEPYYASVKDIKESKQYIHVINECGDVDEYNVKLNIEFVEKPYAVVVNDEGKPIRSIQIDPMSYIEASEEDLVDCEVDGKITKFPKKCIDVLS